MAFSHSFTGSILCRNSSSTQTELDVKLRLSPKQKKKDFTL